MKPTKLFLFSLVLLGFFLGACKPEIDLFAEYKDITVVYGVLDSNQDTNYVIINKVFMDPDMTVIPNDSTNYAHKLDARLVEYRANNYSEHYTKVRELVLDTITLHNKVPGTFESPSHLVYFTKEDLHNNDDYFKYKYELQVQKEDTLLTAETNIVGGTSFSITPAALNFDSYIDMGQIKFAECPNGVLYEVVLEFFFSDITISGDTIPRSMSWSLGSHHKSSLPENNHSYTVSYRAVDFFNTLAHTLGADTLSNNIVERVFFEPSLTISIASCGNELYNFISVNGPSTTISQTIPDYTNINGGYGVLSSRTKIKKAVRLGGRTIPELIARENWRFKQGR